MKEETIILKLIKMYLLHHPLSTARQISDYLNMKNFGLKKQTTAHDIATYIRWYRNMPSHAYKWFKIEVVKTPGEPVKYRMVK